MADDTQIRMAAETILSGSINSQRSSYTQHSITRTPDIILSEAVIAGARQGGRMSNVRRFFCLFVTFDLLLTFLMWLICTMIAGESLQTAFYNQVVHYHITTSLFDIVMAAICRFTVLLLFYALLYLNHWIIVALSTALTCAFLIAKVFLFDWSACSQPVFQVLLIVSSFVLAWAEAWFFDFRVSPQETHARNWMRTFAEPERSPLLPDTISDRRQYNSIEPSNNTFFTPMDSPDISDAEEDLNRRATSSRRLSRSSEVLIPKPLPKLTDKKIEEYKQNASMLLQNSHDLLTSPDWKVETVTTDGDVVSYMHLSKSDGRIVRITGIIDAEAQKLVDWLFEDIESYPRWNKLVTESEKLQHIDENTDIVYQATSPQGGGMITARDFITLRHRGKYDNYYISSGTSIRFDVPRRNNIIRGENSVSCWAAEDLSTPNSGRCRFTWILNTNLRGWLPKKIVDRHMSNGLIDFMTYLRKHVDETYKSI